MGGGCRCRPPPTEPNARPRNSGKELGQALGTHNINGAYTTSEPHGAASGANEPALLLAVAEDAESRLDEFSPQVPIRMLQIAGIIDSFLLIIY